MIIFLNGLYDLVCALCIIYYPNSVFGRIHRSMFSPILPVSSSYTKILPIILVYFGISRISSWKMAVFFSYIIEALLVESLLIYQTFIPSGGFRVIPWKVHFVSITSLLLSSLGTKDFPTIC